MAYQKVSTVGCNIIFRCLRKADLVQADDLNEEDAQLKSELEMLVERLQVSLIAEHFVLCHED